jgi:hypothetical protein
MGICWKTVPWDEDETACWTLGRLEALLVEKGCNLLGVYGGEVGSCSKLGAENSHESCLCHTSAVILIGSPGKNTSKIGYKRHA